LSIIPLNETIEKKAIEIRRSTSVKLPDSIVVATSIILNVILLTDDHQLLNLSLPGFRTQNILRNMEGRMTIRQTVKVPTDHRITLEVPRQIPAGITARFDVIWFPVKNAINDFDTALKKIQNLCKDSSITVDSFREMRRRDNELEEGKYRAFLSDFEVNN